MARVVTKPGFTMVFDEVMDHPDLSLLAINIVSYMERKAWDGCWSGGMQMLADLLKSSKSQVQREIGNLEKAGFLAVADSAVGQRFTYRLLRVQNKASHPGTVCETKSVPPRDGPSHPGTLASHPGTRKRLRPLERKKKTPTPLEKGRESFALSRNGQQREDPQVVAESDGRSGTRTAALALFYPSGVPDTQLRPINRQLNALGKLCDEPEQVEMRYRRWPTVFPNAGACTLRSLVKHWDRLAPPPPNPYHPSGGRSQDEP